MISWSLHKNEKRTNTFYNIIIIIKRNGDEEGGKRVEEEEEAAAAKIQLSSKTNIFLYTQIFKKKRDNGKKWKSGER